MKHIYTFKSLPIVRDQSGETRDISYDIDRARTHSMELTMREFLLCRSWIMNIVISLMAVILVFAMIYGVISIGMKADMSGGTARAAFILCMALSFLALLLILGIPSAIRRLKMDLVTRERGLDNWKIVDENDWEHFCRIVKIADERRKKLMTEARKKALEL